MSTDDTPATTTYTIDDPQKLLRLARVVMATRDQLQELDPGPELAEELGRAYADTIQAIHDTLGERLDAELDALTLQLPQQPSPTELRVAHAQLTGWLEGLFRGIQLAAAQGGAQPPGSPQPPQVGPPPDSDGGAYL